MKNRLQNLKKEFRLLDLDAFLVTDLVNIRYLTGFTGSNAILLVKKNQSYLITDFRYKEQVNKEVRDCKIFVTNTSLYVYLFQKELLKPGMRVGFEETNLPFSLYKRLKKLFKGIKFLPFSDIIENISIIKDDDEIRSTKKAAEISDRAFNYILELIKPGLSEIEIASELSYRMKLLGSEGDAFDIIVASGKNSSLPHLKPTPRKLKENDIVLMDFGAIVNGYHSDISRTIFLGKPSNEEKEIYQIVLDAQKVALNNAREGILARDLDGLARDYISNKGYSKYFIHSLGHGLGLRIHQAPKVSFLSNEVLKENMIITIEPGIYLPKKFGIRIEDDIVIKKDGSINLTKSTKEIVII